MYTMKQVCDAAGMSYETLKFYCNEGLVPGVGRDRNNHRVFSEHNLAWIKSLVCLKNCDMSIAEMKTYLAMCLEGPDSIPRRQVMLAGKRRALEAKMQAVQESLDYIDWKQNFYSEILSGKRPYVSNLIPEYNDDEALELPS